LPARGVPPAQRPPHATTARRRKTTTAGAAAGEGAQSRRTDARTVQRARTAEIGDGNAFDVLEIDRACTQVDKMRDLMETVAHRPIKAGSRSSSSTKCTCSRSTRSMPC
jgi:hypothetical protein